MFVKLSFIRCETQFQKVVKLSFTPCTIFPQPIIEGKKLKTPKITIKLYVTTITMSD
jgi:hypothetical protein